MTKLAECRNCHAPADGLQEILDLGKQYLSNFPAPDEIGGTAVMAPWPLRLLHCPGCGLVQLDTTVPRELLYHDGYGFYSGVNEAIRADLADIVRHAMYYVPDPDGWLDIGCNDGTLLSFVPETCWRTGIDPVPKFASSPLAPGEMITGYFPPPREQWAGLGSYDVITAISMFYDLDDPGWFLHACAELLDDKGVLVIQQNSLLAMLQNNAFDNVSHEHLTYWSLNSFLRLLERHGLEALDVRLSPVNGGVFRVVAGHRGVRTPAPSVAAERYRERRLLGGLLPVFAGSTRLLIQDLRDLVGLIVAEGERVMVYGASTRGAVIWQAAGLGRASSDLGDSHRPWLEAAVERNPEKVGRRYAAVGGIPIISEEEMRADPPSYLLVGPWWFRDQIVERERGFLDGGGALVFPLPYLEVVRR